MGTVGGVGGVGGEGSFGVWVKGAEVTGLSTRCALIGFSPIYCGFSSISEERSTRNNRGSV